jgi:hypothetical protein
MDAAQLFAALTALDDACWLIQAEVSGLGDEQMHTLTPVYERTIAGLLFHLDYHEQLYPSRYIRDFLFRRELTFAAFEDEESWNYRPLASGLQQLASFVDERRRNIRLLQIAGPDVWQRTGIHTRRGKVTLEYCVARVLEHDGYHLQHFRAMRRFLGATAPGVTSVVASTALI